MEDTGKDVDYQAHQIYCKYMQLVGEAYANGERAARRRKLRILGFTAVPTFLGIMIYSFGILPIAALVSFVLSLWWLKLLIFD